MKEYLVLSFFFLATFFGGKILEKIRVPWIFFSLLIGLLLSLQNPFHEVTSAPEFAFLSNLGILFLLFIVGFEFNIKEMIGQGKLVVNTTIVVIGMETIAGSLFVHTFFDVSWPIAILVATSFATVGEALLIPILEEFKIIRKRLGQAIIGVGVLDDVVEVITIMAAVLLFTKSGGNSSQDIALVALVTAILVALLFFFFKLRNTIERFVFRDISSLFILIIAIFFLFVGLLGLINAEALGAILAGIAIQNLVPKKLIRTIDSELKTVAYGFFAPFFFINVGLNTDINYLLAAPLLILAVMLITYSTKLLGSYVMTKKTLGKKPSIILGVSLSVKFSTSLVIIKLFYDNNLLPPDLYSVLIGSTVATQFIIPVLLSHLISRWKIAKS